MKPDIVRTSGSTQFSLRLTPVTTKGHFIVMCSLFPLGAPPQRIHKLGKAFIGTHNKDIIIILKGPKGVRHLNQLKHKLTL